MTEWVSVEDKLPAENEWVLVYFCPEGESGLDNDTVTICRFDHKKKEWVCEYAVSGDYSPPEVVTHWMHFPASPKVAEALKKQLEYMKGLKEYY